ncbi:MAG: ATP synthase F1 subunit epsilon [Bdellovibrionaceae bacterium]|nr:ATP synthase F1 subunit epsilon [Pseudobdellovibrionaceae bacterium]
MKVSLFTPEKVLIKDKEFKELIVPSVKGYLGILPGHAPLVSLLQAGVLKYLPKNSEKWESLALGWGYLEVYSEGVRILAESAETKSTLDKDKIHKKLKSILEQLEKINLEPQKRQTLEREKLWLEGQLEL